MPDKSKRNTGVNMSPMHHMSPQHVGMSPSHSSNHSTSMSPPSVNMSPQNMSPHSINMSPQNMNMSPQHMNMSPQHVNMSPPHQQVNMSPPQQVNMSPPHQQINMPPGPMDGMGMMNDMGNQNTIGYQAALPKLAPNIQPRSPVLGTLMVSTSVPFQSPALGLKYFFKLKLDNLKPKGKEKYFTTVHELNSEI